MNNNYITVGALTRYIKYKIDNDVNLQTVYIKGEISNFKHHSRGHFYFTIKDEESRINAIMFASSTKNINFEPVDGMKVLVKGRISVFEQTGNYQIYVTDMTEDGRSPGIPQSVQAFLLPESCRQTQRQGATR